MDSLPGTVAIWREALTVNRVWDQGRDTPRIRKAFLTLASSRRSWPAPPDLIEALPKSDQARLPRPTDIPGTREMRERKLQELLYKGIKNEG